VTILSSILNVMGYLVAISFAALVLVVIWAGIYMVLESMQEH